MGERPKDDDQKLREMRDLIEEHPNSVPIVITSINSRLKLACSELMFARSAKVGQLLSKIRKFTNTKDTASLTLFVNGKILNLDQTVGDVYQKHHDQYLCLNVQVRDIESLGG